MCAPPRRKKANREMLVEEVELQFAGKAQAVDRLTQQHDPAYNLDVSAPLPAAPACVHAVCWQCWQRAGS